MKKGLYAGAVALLLLVNFNCSAPVRTDSTSLRPQAKVAPKITIVDERDIRDNTSDTSSDLDAAHRAPKKELYCEKDDDCAAIPVPADACIPCGDNARAVRRDVAKSIMQGLKDTCIAKFKDKEPECAEFKAADCDEASNTCVLIDISKEELKKRAEQMRAKQGQGQGQGGQGPSERSPRYDQEGSAQGYGQQGSFPGQGYGGPQGNFDGRGYGAHNKAGFANRQPGFDRGYENGSWNAPQDPRAGNGYGGLPQNPGHFNFDQGRGFPGGNSPWGGQPNVGPQSGWGQPGAGSPGFGAQNGYGSQYGSQYGSHLGQGRNWR